MEFLSSKMRKINTLLDRFRWFPLCFSRLVVGWVFLAAGYGKFTNLDQVIGYFESLQIPFAPIQAPMVAGIELLSGLALLLGLGTRIFASVLSVIMVVALMTAHREDIHFFSDIFKIYEFVYIIVLTFLATYGAGAFSIDGILKK